MFQQLINKFMPRKKAEVAEEVEITESDAKKEFQKLMDIYKEQNPDKYEAKKASFEAKLNSL